MKEKASNPLKIPKEIIKIAELDKKRIELGLNPICWKCGRIMRAKEKHRTHAVYYCICTPGILMDVG